MGSDPLLELFRPNCKTLKKIALIKVYGRLPVGSLVAARKCFELERIDAKASRVQPHCIFAGEHTEALRMRECFPKHAQREAQTAPCLPFGIITPQKSGQKLAGPAMAWRNGQSSEYGGNLAGR
jgi:hypothetical protein